ncbi:MAG: DNA gyrase subunit A [Oscillospiraceae bacterium]|nr:MAG: DNA gyrase subunit A [Oscillospiraceae bacterium]
MDDNKQGRLIDVEIEKEMKDSYLAYSMSVIVGRALPDVRDGLKPVHRRILYTMYEANNTPDNPYRKCAYTVGEVLGRFHPHGDASVYDALVRLAQDFSLRMPLVDGHGNFGSIDGDPAAAYRYTEARMSKAAMPLLTDIEKDTVDFGPNYDGRLKEPVVLPSRYPNLLVNGSTGIAVGMATNIPPHNLGEVIDAVCALIDNPDASVEELMTHLPGPDFPTGGIIMGRSGIRAAYATGRGKITVRSRTEIEEMPSGRERIVVTELPYGVNKARLIESIAELVKEKRIEQISDLRDESDRDGMRIVVELKRDANAAVVLNQLFSYTQMQDTFGVIMLALADGVPKVMNLREMLRHYIRFQEEVVARRTRFDLKKAKERAHILEGLRRAVDIVDEIIATIRATKGGIPEAKAAIIEKFDFDEPQAAAIVAFRIGQLAGLEIQKILDELASLEQKIAEWEALLADEHRLLGLVKEEIQAIGAKFPNPRRTEIQTVTGEVDIEDLIPETDCVITLTHYGYIKRQAIDTYHTQKRGGRGVTGMSRREEDFVTDLFLCSTHDYILFFTSRGRAYRMKGYEIPESSRSGKGINIVNLLPLEQGEKITAAIKADSFDEQSYLCMVTKRGVAKRISLSAFRNIRKAGLIAVSLDEGDELGWVRMTRGDEDLIIATRQGRAIRFGEQEVREMGRNARGVRAIRLAQEDEVVGMARVRPGSCLLTVSESGQGRRTPIDDYPLHSRGGLGVLNYYTGKNGPVAGIKSVDETDEIFLISDDGIIIRINAADIAVQSRYGGGVRVMRLAEGSKVVTLARAPAGEADEEDESDEEREEDLPSDEE